MNRAKNNSAFTLIELLVVIAIISLLVSILLPSLQKAKEQAQITVCLATLRSIGAGIFTYAGEYDGYPPEAWDGGRTWARRLKDKDYMNMFRCPAHTPRYSVAEDEELRSYALNAWTTLAEAHNEFGGDSYCTVARCWSMDKITQPAVSGLAIEIWRGYHWSAGYHENTIDKWYSEINHLFCPHNLLFSGDLGLHGENLIQNVLFYDGHTESYPFEYYPRESGMGYESPESFYGWKWTMRGENEL